MHQHHVPLTNKKTIAKLLNCFANNGYNIAEAAKCNGMTYNKARWYVNKYYTRLPVNDQNEVRIFQSKL